MQPAQLTGGAPTGQSTEKPSGAVAPDRPTSESAAHVQPARPETSTAAPAPPGAAPVIERLSRHLHILTEEVTVLQVARAEWPNTCLGLAAEGEICGQMITPGYAVSLEANGQRYEFRTDDSGRRIRLASAPVPGIGKPLVTWSDSQSFNMLVLGTEGISFGLRGGTLLTAPFAIPERARDLEQFLATYAPFQARTAAGEVTFAGVGPTQAGPTEQRLIAEWAKLVWTEADQGLGFPKTDRALQWSREGGSAGFCDKVIIGRAGSATAWSCRSGEDRLVARLALTNEHLGQLFAWLDRFERVVIDASDTVRTEAVTLTIELDGTGLDTVSEADREAIIAYINAVVRELLIAPTS